MTEIAANPLSATILEIQRMSTEDGPGIRTTVFFKGCSLKCSWCHNPESISPRPQIHWIANRCIGCHTCLDVCPETALSPMPDGIHIDRGVCSGCGLCAEECPSTAMELLGTQWDLPALVAEVIKDKAYFDQSGGGVTVGGGEPTLQAPFVSGFLTELKNRGIRTAIDTCGLCSQDALAILLADTDLLLFDLKEMNPDRHMQYTGSHNKKIFDNLFFVRESMKANGYPRDLWIRTPVIPGATATVDNIRNIGAFIGTELDGLVTRWDLCAFNNLCRDKYLRLDLDWPYQDADLLSKLFMEKMAAIARNSGVNPDIVQWSGSTRMEENNRHTNAA